MTFLRPHLYEQRATQQMIHHTKTPELKVYSDPSLQLMVVQASGIVPSAVYRHGLSLATEIAIKEKSLFWLVNNLEGGIITSEDQVWATEVNAPILATKSSIRKMAFIEPRDLYSKFILEDMMNIARNIFSFEMQFFEDVPSALAWFRDTVATEFNNSSPKQTAAEEENPGL